MVIQWTLSISYIVCALEYPNCIAKALVVIFSLDMIAAILAAISVIG